VSGSRSIGVVAEIVAALVSDHYTIPVDIVNIGLDSAGKVNGGEDGSSLSMRPCNRQSYKEDEGTTEYAYFSCHLGVAS
jgi:hypothetical protein